MRINGRAIYEDTTLGELSDAVLDSFRSVHRIGMGLFWLRLRIFRPALYRRAKSILQIRALRRVGESLKAFRVAEVDFMEAIARSATATGIADAFDAAFSRPDWADPAATE